jgi:cyclase
VILCGLSTPAAEESPHPRSEALPAQAVDGASAGGLRQIQPGHYVYMHTDDTPGVSSTFNSGIIVTSEGVVVVDALGSEEIARRVREAIARVTDQPVRFLVSSTFHGRFTGGNAVYRDAFNIGHERYREDLMGLLGDMSPENRAARLPDQTYRERVTLHLGGKEIRILHLGRAHTRGDSIVFVPEDRIAYLSEVFNFDEFPYTRDSYPGDWLRTLEAAAALEADVFVPGHGFLPDDPRDTGRASRAIDRSCSTCERRWKCRSSRAPRRIGPWPASTSRSTAVSRATPAQWRWPSAAYIRN